MKRGQLATVIIIVLLVAAVGGFYVFSDKRAGQATRTLTQSQQQPTQPTYPTSQPATQPSYPTGQPSQSPTVPTSPTQPAGTISTGPTPPPVMAEVSDKQKKALGGLAQTIADMIWAAARDKRYNSWKNSDDGKKWTDCKDDCQKQKDDCFKGKAYLDCMDDPDVNGFTPCMQACAARIASTPAGEETPDTPAQCKGQCRAKANDNCAKICDKVYDDCYKVKCKPLEFKG